MTANSPYWWQRLFPHYGNWGGPGWSSGQWVNNPARTDWSVNGIDKMDFVFKRHDYAYQRGRDVILADRGMILALAGIRPKTIYGKLYKRLAIIAFTIHIKWLETRRNEQ